MKMVNIAQIFPPIIVTNTVDVVNFIFWPFASYIKKRQTMTDVFAAH